MSTRYPHASRLLWSLTSSGKGTTLTASGDTGGWSAGINVQSAIDLREITDVWLSVYVAGTVTGTTPSLVANLDVFDDQGNLFPALLSTAAISGTTTGKAVSGGLHGGAGSVVFPSFGRVSWTVTGTTPVFNQVAISLFGR